MASKKPAPALEVISAAFEPLLVDERQLPALDGMSRMKRRAEIAAGRYPAPVRLGARKIMWRLACVKAWAASLPVATGFSGGDE